MQFEKGKSYKHRFMVDVAFTVKNARKVDEGTLMRVQWYNTHYKQYVYLVDRILVLNTQLGFYNEYAIPKTILRRAAS